MINQQVFEGRWSSLKGRLQEKWGQLTDDDLRKAEGNANQLIGVIQEKTGQARERIEAELEKLIDGGVSFVDAATEKVRGAAHEASERVQQGYEQVSEHVRDGYQHAQKSVQKRPVEAIAVAFGSGLIAGVIVGLVLRSR
jgi:uncharacterized protein YjbJ (UPF0337 family)